MQMNKIRAKSTYKIDKNRWEPKVMKSAYKVSTIFFGTGSTIQLLF